VQAAAADLVNHRRRPTGVELAGALAEIARQTLRDDFRHISAPESARIILVEGGPYVLGAFPDTLRAAARASLEKLGVDVRTNARRHGQSTRTG